jgi:hypothetical protein
MTIYTAAYFPLRIRETLATRFSGLIEYSATFLIDKGTSLFGQLSVGSTIATTSGLVTIFPAPTITRNNDQPFDELNVTAYGQGFSLNNRTIMGTEVLELSKTFRAVDQTQNPPVELNWTVYETWRCETATRHSVLANTSTNYTSPTAFLDRKFLRRWIIGTVASGGRNELNINWQSDIRDISRTNYGAWDEVAVMKGYVPVVS